MPRDKEGKHEEHNRNGKLYFQKLYEMEDYYRQGKSYFDYVIIINITSIFVSIKQVN